MRKSQISLKEPWLRPRATRKIPQTDTCDTTIVRTRWRVRDYHFSNRRSKLIFKNAEKEDFGVYSVSVTNTDGVSSSYGISSEGTIYTKLHPALTSVCKQLFASESARLLTVL